MINQTTFEIKVAILGHVSVGKTTVLNALLQDQFSEVSMRRTTAGVNFFRIVQTPSGKRKPSETTCTSAKPGNNDTKTAVHVTDWSSLHLDEPVLTAASTHTEISQDNQKLREEKTIQEKVFNIKVSEPICEMRNDTTLVFVDVPGLNEAGSKQMYLNYVSQKWDTFDCVVIVMDAEKSVNTEEQVDLLKLVKRNLEQSKNIPVIVLCNKVDNPDDGGVMELVGEVRRNVEQIFKVGSRSDSLSQLLNACRDGKRCGGTSLYPVFIPLSAGNAFAYRKTANCSLEEFKKLDLKLIDKIGRDEVGKTQWKSFSLDKKYKTVFAIMRNARQYQDLLESTNFDKFLSALAYSIGGNDVQRDLLSMQVEVSLGHLSSGSPIVSQLRPIYHRYKVIDVDTTHLRNYFWKLFNALSEDAIRRVESDVDPTPLAITLDELISYRRFALEVGWNQEDGKIIEQVIALVGQQLGIILEKENQWKIDGAVLSAYDFKTERGCYQDRYFPFDWEPSANGWRNIWTGDRIEGTKNPATVSLTWKSLTYHDWATIIGSLLLMTNNRHFCERFGREKIALEKLFQRHTFYANCLTSGTTTAEKNALANILGFSEGGFVSRKFVPKDSTKYSLVAQVEAPERIGDLSHWGHLIWKFGLLMEDKQPHWFYKFLLLAARALFRRLPGVCQCRGFDSFLSEQDNHLEVYPSCCWFCPLLCPHGRLEQSRRGSVCVLCASKLRHDE